jgi:hypothetical protein
MTSPSWLDLPDRFTPDRALGNFRADPGQRYVLADLDGPGCIRHLWMTTRALPMVNRSMILRIYWDGEEHPSVEAPLGDFFGMCHGLGYYPLNTPYLSAQDQSGYNAYFPMPFARSARIELEVDPAGPPRPFYYHVDWHRYRQGSFREDLRFHAAWRRECPTQAYGEEYLVLDAVGRGRLLGFVYGVRLLDDADRWSHGGAENLYVDGEATGVNGVEPAFIRGSGGEDTFGTSYGGALHKPETHLYAGIPFYYHEDVGQARPAQRLAAYRFFEHDAITFERSLHFRFGCVANDICSTAYWYQTNPHRPFLRLPEWEKLHPGTELRRGAADLLEAAGATGPDAVRSSADDGEWWLCGPFENEHGQAMQRVLPPEEGALPSRDARYDGGFGESSPWRNPRSGKPEQHVARWVRRRSLYSFVDFAHVFRPWTRGVSVTWPAAACAQTQLWVEEATTALLHLAWDDQLVVRLNDDPPLDLPHQSAFRRQAIPITLRRGRNDLLLKLSNTKGFTWGAWCFTCRAVLPNGQVIVPQIGEG